MQERHLLILSIIAGIVLGLAVPALLMTGQESADPVSIETDHTGTEVQIIEVVDGDTIDVRYRGRTETVRLLGIDTPEVHSPVAPDEWEGHLERSCLRDHGHEATEYVRALLKQGNISLRFDSESDRRGYYDRLLAYVIADGENVNKKLIDTGLARYYDSDFTRAAAFQAAETSARENQEGAWAC